MGPSFRALGAFTLAFALFLAPARAEKVDPSVELAKKKVAAIERGTELLGDPEIAKHGIYFNADNSRIVVFVPHEAFAATMKDGILNLHEVGATRGLDAPAERKAFENTVLQADIDALPGSKKIRPKSGIVLNAFTAGFVNPSELYGSVAIVLKPGVFARALWSHADSLETRGFQYDAFLPKPFSVPYDERVFPAIGASPKRGWSEVESYGEHAGKIAYEEARYVEALVFGALTKTDVESVAFFPGAPKEMEAIAKEYGLAATRMKSRKLRPLFDRLGLSDDIPPASTRPISPKTYRAMAKPPAKTWKSGSRKPETSDFKRWLAQFDRKYGPKIALCEKKHPGCDEFGLFEGLGEYLEHPYATSPEGFDRVARLLAIDDSRYGTPRFGGDLCEHFFVQPGVWTESRGRKLFADYLKRLDGPDFRQHMDLANALERLHEKPYFWIHAPDEVAALVKLAVKYREKWSGLENHLRHRVSAIAELAYPNGVLADRIPGWAKIRAKLKGEASDGCRLWLRAVGSK